MEKNLRDLILSKPIFTLLTTLLLMEFMRGALLFAILPLYLTENLGLSKTVMGAALAVHYFTDNLLRPLAGWLIDRYGQKLVLIIGITIAFVSLYIVVQTHTTFWVFAGLGLLGVGTSPTWPSVITGTIHRVPEQDRATMMGIMFQFWIVGAGLGPILINLIPRTAYSIAFFVLFGCLGVAFLLALFFQNWQTHIRNRTDQTNLQYFRTLKQRIKSVSSFFPGMFAQTFAFALLIPILTVYANSVLHLPTMWFSILLTTGGLVTVLFLIPIGRLVDRFGARYFLIAGFVISGLLLLILPLFRTIGSLMVLICIIGFAYALILPSWNTILSLSIPADQRGAMWGIFMTVEGIGSATGPLAGGTLYDAFGPAAPFFVSAVVFLLMAVVYWLHPLTRKYGSGTLDKSLYITIRRKRRT
ncbi:MFS transporter [Fodinisporobacter ferrooxydans]|uniref:MFS transporter n=1 Tax=Fodinisporobacter ferrooxydans TaxID=2901836 RepID=A0ABY4CG41_9BACL|nr:MFS transporter [Alicyclobacillaceae bacterium MYW30-H2]